MSVKLDGQEKPVHELVLFTSMGRSVLRVASVEMGHSVIQLMATAYVLQVRIILAPSSMYIAVCKML